MGSDGKGIEWHGHSMGDLKELDRMVFCLNKYRYKQLFIEEVSIVIRIFYNIIIICLMTSSSFSSRIYVVMFRYLLVTVLSSSINHSICMYTRRY